MKAYRITTGAEFTADGSDISETQFQRYLHAAKYDATCVFGGCSVFQGQGTWVGGEQGIVEERMVTIEIWSASLAGVKMFAERVRHHFQQKTIGFVHPDGTAELVGD